MDDAGLVTARDRIRHVVVLMLENRSFDHLLGYLNYPGLEPLKDGDYPNPAGTTPNAPTIGVSRDAREILRLDPPHSHISVKQQMHRRRRGFAMDGFINAYARKLRGDEDTPVFHWYRIELLAIAFTALLAFATENVALHIEGGAWLAFVGFVGAAALVATAMCWTPLRLIGWPWWKRLLPGLAGAFVGSGLDALVHLGSVEWWRWAIFAAVFFVLSTGGVMWLRSTYGAREAVSEAQVADECRHIMRCMDPDRVRVFSMLAEQFAVCTRWHASVPGATWPNRNFAHAATSESTVDIEIGLYDTKTIFEVLEEAANRQGLNRHQAWRIYHDGMAQTLAFDRLWSDGRAANWHEMHEFFDHVVASDLPWYSFIEPHHSRDDNSNSQHPGNNQEPTGGRSDFHRGELLVQSIYEALRRNEHLFQETMLVITYDEHGGLFDHAEPPAARHPTPLHPKFSRLQFTRRVVAWFVENRYSPFDFRRLGVRVPALVISPWIAPRTVERDHVFDHTSIIATLRLLFAPEERPLTARDRAAIPFYELVRDATAARTMPESPPPAPPEPTVVPGAGEPAPPLPGAMAPRATQADTLSEQLNSLEQQLRELTALGLAARGERPAIDEIDVTERFVDFSRDERARTRVA